MGTLTESPSRLAWRATEPLHAMIYLVPEAAEAHVRAGISPVKGYFASRGAVFGAVGPSLVTATFYNFNPALVAQALPAAWETVTPERMLADRLTTVTAALTRGLGAATLAGPEVAEAAELARTAALHATTIPQGRPLFAAYAELAWPEEPHLVLFHAQTLLREFRGDGHVAALVEAGVGGLEAIVLHAAAAGDEGTYRFLRYTRGWSGEAWDAATEGLRERGLIDGDRLSEEGARFKAELEATTDRLAEPAYATLGEKGCLRLAELTRPLSRTLIKNGLLDVSGLTKKPREQGH
ncbi:hypothetical protein [Actinoplanes sp. NPDC051851]|uniref:SCO6745 family protein n=1 Tax=Actinoplanes sp. NPDC051851 TaxID=3154753 RepID=UPI0034164B81